MMRILPHWRTFTCGLLASAALLTGALHAQDAAPAPAPAPVAAPAPAPTPAAAPAAEAPAAPAGPTVEQRIFDLEKYVQN
ncbi:hypothetical protein, partial [Prosthecobacter dejongeii]|uniref:hypothetical protein n=1 Tax=Prosthecobacter dejongeii TaxID=48465 RepID=UPI001C859BAB